MAEVVDAIIADLTVKYQQYVDGFDKATAAHARFTKSVPKISGFGGINGIDAAEAQKYVDRHTKAGNDVAKVEEATAAKVTRSRKARITASVAADKAEVDSAKKAAAEKVAAEEAAQARATAAVERGMARRAAAVRAGSGRINNPDLSRGTTPLFIPSSVLNGGATAEVAATGEVDRLTRDIAINKARLVGLEGQERAELQREIAYLETYNRLKRAGVAETEAQAIAERQVTAMQEKQLVTSRAQRFKNVSRFAEGAGIGRSYGGLATVGGIAVAAGVGLSVEAIGAATKYGQALSEVSKQAGLSAESLQVYQHAAQQAGVDNDQFNSALQTLTGNLGKARTGSKEQSKAFAALGVDIHTAATAGDLLPTLIDRISSIPDAAKRARVETALFGATGEKLDSMLSGGNEAINNLAQGLIDTGAILSSSDIAKLDDTAHKLAAVKAQLMVDMAQIVASNADAIERLANAFASLTGSIPGALRWLDQMNNRLDVAGGWFQKNILANAVEGAGFTQLAQAYRQAGAENMRSGGNALGRDVLHGGVNGNAAVGQGLLSSVLHPTSVQAGSVNNSLLNKLGAGNGGTRRGPSAESLQAQADARDRRFANEQRQLQEQQLSALSDLTGDTRQQDEYQRQRIRLEQQARDKDYDLEADQEIARGKLKGAAAAEIRERAEQNKKLNDANADLAIQGVNRKEASRTLNEQLEKQRTALEIESDRLTNESALADTTAERRRIALRQLEIERQNEEASLNRVIEDKSSTPEAVDNAQARLKALPSIYDGKQSDIIRQTETSLDAYKRSLEVTADTISDFGVHILQDFNSELDNSITKALHLHGVFGQIIGDLIDMAIKQQVIGPLANSGGFGGFLGSIGKLFGAGGGGLDVGSITSATSSLLDAGLPGLAAGGSGIIGGRPGVDQNVLSINGVPQLRVGKGELLSVSPNVALSNHRVAAPAPQQTVLVVQPIHADFSGARTDEQTMRAFTAYADARSKQAYEAAVATAGSQVGGIVQRKQTLGN